MAYPSVEPSDLNTNELGRTLLIVYFIDRDLIIKMVISLADGTASQGTVPLTKQFIGCRVTVS